MTSLPTVAEQVAVRPVPRALSRYGWGVLAYFTVVIVYGALVRATGSGAGCGNHWPLCNGSVLQPSPSLATLIEFTHRITSGLSLLAVLGLAGWTRLGTTKGHLARPLAAATVFLTLMEAVLGALLVKLDLTANSVSPLRPPFLALHLTNTLVLLGSLTLTAHFLTRKTGSRWDEIQLRAPWSALSAVAAILVVGVTGSLAALGDTLFPASTLHAAFAQDFASTSEWLVRWRWSHPVLALVAVAAIARILLVAFKADGSRKLARLVVLLAGLTVLLGSLDVLLLAPVWLQVVHLAAAQALWASLVVLAARTTFVPTDKR